jgi:glycopeptide antibiotics resistance protein
MLRFHKGYFLAATGLLLLEIFIALFVHDRFIRPYAGDFLATILLYCLLGSFFRASEWRLAGVALLISYIIEGLQYIDLLGRLGWHSRVARIVFGSHFEWGDMLAYTLGGAVALAISLHLAESKPHRSL